MTLSEKLLYLRKNKGLSQEQLAAQITVSRQAISKWELDESLPDTENIVHLTKIFNVSADFLLDDKIDIPIRSLEKASQDENKEDITLSLLKKEFTDDDERHMALKVYAQNKNKKNWLAPTIVGVVIIVAAVYLLFFGNNP